MFNNTDIEKYRSIKAPESLKGRVMELETENKKRFNVYKFAQIAACLMLVCVLGFAGMNTIPAKVNYNGIIAENEIYLSDSGIAVASVRSAQISNEIEINALLFSNIKISGGYFEVINNRNGEIIYSGNDYLASGKTILRVYPENESAVLTLSRLFFERDIVIKK